MAALRDLPVQLDATDDQGNDDDDDDQEVVYDGTAHGVKFSALPSDDDRPWRAGAGWRKYTPSLRTVLPIRPFTSTPDPVAVDESGCVSFITYSWVFPYMWAAFRGVIERDPKWRVSPHDAAGVNAARLDALWRAEQGKNRRGGPSLFLAVIKFFRTRLILASFTFAFCLAFGFIGPTCLVRSLVAYIERGSTDFTYGLWLVAALFLVEMLRVLSYGASWAISYRSGLRVRAALLQLLFDKMLTARDVDRNSGEIVSMYANDGQRVFDAVTFAPLVLTGPFVLVGGVIYLLYLIGPWCLLGVAVFFVFDVVQAGLGITMVRCRRSAIAHTEARVMLTGEFVRCAKAIKMNAIEEPLSRRINAHRLLELSSLRTAGLAQSLAIATGSCVPIIATVLTFVAHVWSGNQLSASQAFSAVTVFYVMMFGVRMIPYGMRYLGEALVAVRHVQGFFQTSADDDHKASEAGATPLHPQPDCVLHSLNLVIEKGSMVGVCGPVGSGKSALLQAIIGQLHQCDPSASFVAFTGRVAYCAQEPWILNMSIRENILFGECMDEHFYYRVLHGCALNHDISGMRAHDLTEIGDRGMTLSGGQRSRVALARALFARRDVYLFDDVLGSLDAPVAEHVWRHGIRATLASKTVMVVLNSVNRLSECDEVVYMEAGRVIDQGPHDQLRARCAPYAKYCQMQTERSMHTAGARIENYLPSSGSPSPTPGDSSPPPKGGRDESPPAPRRHSMGSGDGDNMSIGELVGRLHAHGSNTTLSGAESLFDIPEADTGDTSLTCQEEDFGLGQVSWHVYKRYAAAAGGWPVALGVAIAFVFNVAANVFASVWLSHWLQMGHLSGQGAGNATDKNMSIGENATSSEAPMQQRGVLVIDEHLTFYIIVYLMSLALLFFSGIAKAFVYVKVTLRAALRLHDQMFNSIKSAAMTFFDTNPAGRILNRFSKDIDEVDVKLPFSSESLLQNLFAVLAYLIVIAAVFPHFLLAAVPLGAVFYILVACFRAGIRSLQRAENVSRSPLYAHITSTLAGMSTVRAFGHNTRFSRQLAKLLDANSAAMFTFHAGMRWLAVWLDLLVVAVTSTVALLMVLLADSVPAAYAGLALSLAIQMSGIMQLAVRMHSELEAKMTSVERIDYYIQGNYSSNYGTQKVDREPNVSHSVATGGVQPDWPHSGRISFRDVRLRYRPAAPLALNDVTLDVRPSEKVGIVGRTGSGKSSLAAALWRLYELEASAGNISIDGLDISAVPLPRLRQCMAAVPQEPELFSGTVRFNVDPDRKHEDVEVWRALERAHLKDKIQGLSEGLDTNVTDAAAGGQFSAGQRQLLCLARALLRGVRILLLDEATSSLDALSERAVRKVLKDAFSGCTQMVIAHRLDSVTGLDKIVVMEGGRIVEYGAPTALLSDGRSRFYHMMRRARADSALKETESELGSLLGAVDRRLLRDSDEEL